MPRLTHAPCSDYTQVNCPAIKSPLRPTPRQMTARRAHRQQHQRVPSFSYSYCQPVGVLHRCHTFPAPGSPPSSSVIRTEKLIGFARCNSGEGEWGSPLAMGVPTKQTSFQTIEHKALDGKGEPYNDGGTRSQAQLSPHDQTATHSNSNGADVTSMVLFGAVVIAGAAACLAFEQLNALSPGCTLAVNLVQCVCGIVQGVPSIVMYLRWRSIPLRYHCVTAMLSFGAGWLNSVALGVGGREFYPAFTAIRSATPIASMFTAWLLLGRKCNKAQVIALSILCLGIAVTGVSNTNPQPNPTRPISTPTFVPASSLELNATSHHCQPVNNFARTTNDAKTDDVSSCVPQAQKGYQISAHDFDATKGGEARNDTTDHITRGTEEVQVTVISTPTHMHPHAESNVSTFPALSFSSYLGAPSAINAAAVAVACASLVPTTFLGVVQERAFTAYGRGVGEAVFYQHLLSLPLFAVNAQNIATYITQWSSGDNNLRAREDGVEDGVVKGGDRGDGERGEVFGVLRVSCLSSCWMFVGLFVGCSEVCKHALLRLIAHSGTTAGTLSNTMHRFVASAVSSASPSGSPSTPAPGMSSMCVGATLVGIGSALYVRCGRPIQPQREKVKP